jgi:hypothetical protein
MTPDAKRRNIRLLYAELAWMAFPFAMEWWYLHVYAIRLGATPVQIGLLSAGRALFLVIGASLGNWWQGRFANIVQSVALPIFVARTLLYAGIALVPSLPVPFKVELLIGLAISAALPMGIAQAGFLGMLPAAVDKHDLARVVSRRSLLMNATILLALVIVGQLLEALVAPQNYQVGFGLACLASTLSWWNIRAIRVPDSDAKTERARRVKVWSNPTFRRFALLILAANTSVFMAAPLVQLHLVRGLAASDGWISFFGITEMLAGALGTATLPWLQKRFSSSLE